MRIELLGNCGKAVLILGLAVIISLNVGCDDEPTKTKPQPEITSSFEGVSQACDSSFYALTPDPQHLQVVGFYQAWGCSYSLGFLDWYVGGSSIGVDLDLWTTYGHDCFGPPCAGSQYVIHIYNIPPGTYYFTLRYRRTSPFFPNNPTWDTAWEDTVHVR